MRLSRSSTMRFCWGYNYVLEAQRARRAIDTHRCCLFHPHDMVRQNVIDRKCRLWNMALVSSRCACVSVNVRVKKYYTHGIWAEEGHAVGPRVLAGEQSWDLLQRALVESGDEEVVVLALAALGP